MRTPDRMLVMLALIVGVSALGCGDNDNNAPPEQPSPTLQCEVVGTLCHDSDTDAGQACHELGHQGPPSQCAVRFSGCIDECLGEKDGDPICRALGSLCHDTESHEGQACHELGHENDADACRAAFDDCAETCLQEH